MYLIPLDKAKKVIPSNQKTIKLPKTNSKNGFKKD